MRAILFSLVGVSMMAAFSACAQAPNSFVITNFPGAKISDEAQPKPVAASPKLCEGNIVCVEIPCVNAVKSPHLPARHLKPTALYAVVTKISQDGAEIRAFEKHGKGGDKYAVAFSGRVRQSDLIYDGMGIFRTSAASVQRPRLVLSGNFPTCAPAPIRRPAAKAAPKNVAAK